MSTGLRAQDIADYFLSLVDEEEGDSITHLKLQKLLYFAQGLYSAMHPDEPLFAEPIEAWQHGPVVPVIYQLYKQRGSTPIPRPEAFDANQYAPEVREMLDTVYSVYGQYSALKLSRLSHTEKPYVQVALNEVITVGSLRDFFSQLVEAGKSGNSIDGEPVWPTLQLRFQRRKAFSRKMVPRRDRLRELASRIDPLTDPWLSPEED